METRIGFGRRFGAFVIDFIFIFGIGFIIASVTGDFFERFFDWSKMTEQQISAIEGNSMLWTFSILMPAAATIVSFFYNIIEGFTGFTLGKLMLGIQIGNQDGTPAEQGKLMIRFAIKNISTIIGLIGIATMVSMIGTVGSALGFVIFIGCFFVLGEKKLALHDMLAKTAVYRKSQLADGSAAELTVTNEVVTEEEVPAE